MELEREAGCRLLARIQEGTTRDRLEENWPYCWDRLYGVPTYSELCVLSIVSHRWLCLLVSSHLFLSGSDAGLHSLHNFSAEPISRLFPRPLCHVIEVIARSCLIISWCPHQGGKYDFLVKGQAIADGVYASHDNESVQKDVLSLILLWFSFMRKY